MINWWTIYNNALKRGEYPTCAQWLADEWAKRKGRENENPKETLPEVREKDSKCLTGNWK